MSQFTRRSMLKGAAAALPATGIFALPGLARAIENNSSPQQRPKVKITDIRTAEVLVHGPQTHVRVYTDSGLYGQGESTVDATAIDVDWPEVVRDVDGVARLCR